MKKHILLLTIFVFSISIFSACKKNKTVAKSNTELLTQKPWKVTEAGFDSNNDGNIDVPETLDACFTDDIIQFLEGNAGTWDDGPTKCNPDDPQVQSFTWSFTNAETFLNFDSETLRILTLSESSLDLSNTYDSGGGIFVTEILKFKH